MTAKKKKKSARRGAPNTNNKKKSAAVRAADEPEQIVADIVFEDEPPAPPEASRYRICDPEPPRKRRRTSTAVEADAPIFEALADRVALIIAAILICGAALLALCIASGARIDSVTVGEDDGAILFWSESAGGYEGTLLFTDSGSVKVVLNGERVTLKYANGDLYVGEATDFLPNGEGIMYYADGSTLKGYFAKGLPHGLATLDWANGNRYEGDFTSGVKQGNG